jgi:hypothetical protein
VTAFSLRGRTRSACHAASDSNGLDSGRVLDKESESWGKVCADIEFYCAKRSLFILVHSLVIA